MRVLHTSDWHVGRAVRGRSREEEHRAVLSEIADLVGDEGIDLVLIAGDIFDHQAPTATSEDIVYESLLKFTAAGAQVVLIAGNHDHPERLEAVRPLLRLANVHAGARLRRPEDGGCLDMETRSGEKACIALMPWPSRSRIVTADDLMSKEQAEHQSQYWERCGRILRTLCGGFRDDAVNMVLAHLVITGSVMGGGERSSETVEDYWVPPEALNLNAQYVALGHIHKPQSLNMIWPAWYCGSPLQLDFGEEKDTKGVLIFEAKPGLPVREPRFVELKSGRRMLTVRASLEQLASQAAGGEFRDAYLRVFVADVGSVGLADEVREMLPNAVEVRVDAGERADRSELATRVGLQPHELLAKYFEQANVQGEGLMNLFNELLEEENEAPSP